MLTENPHPQLNNTAGGRASDQIERELTRMILSLELAPGSMQQESMLVTLLGCGRTPLREALQRLSRDGLIEMRPRQGIQVTPLDIHDFYDMMEAMVVIEPRIGWLAAGRISPSELADLRAILGRYEQALDNPPGLLMCDFDFHYGIARASRNACLVETDVHLHRLIQRYALLSWQSTERSLTALQEHRQILEQLAAGNAAETERLIAEHVAHSKDLTVQGFEEYRNKIPRVKPGAPFLHTSPTRPREEAVIASPE